MQWITYAYIQIVRCTAPDFRKLSIHCVTGLNSVSIMCLAHLIFEDLAVIIGLYALSRRDCEISLGLELEKFQSHLIMAGRE